MEIDIEKIIQDSQKLAKECYDSYERMKKTHPECNLNIREYCQGWRMGLYKY